ncbi:thiamine-phosphate kinase [Legionella spiritensis]|uniref:thiamine-phosphate kinase n=1 Tax=Legionella spiritensis TaxID=452 RepID=UPI000F6EA99C|nr:thiamine-phosphate kinase [Legionella spiritensis]VEG92431.1 thiamine monophosphate kinase (AIR synthase) [Legionella spiritensis]
MNEFAIIDSFFSKTGIERKDVVFGIGDDAACVQVPVGHQLLISTDTLVADVHFLRDWDPYDIAWKSVMVNVSDIAAMGGQPCWVSLALTMPFCDESWLTRFSEGLHDALRQFNIMLIGGDTTHGPLSITLTIHGLIETGKSVRRNGAKPGDKIMVTGELGGAALAVSLLEAKDMDGADQKILMQKLQRPCPRVDYASVLRTCASAAIDISDGLSADLAHICAQSQVGACLDLAKIPVHPLVIKYQGYQAVDFALGGGDDYELCFTLPDNYEKTMHALLEEQGLVCYSIGIIVEGKGLMADSGDGRLIPLSPKGYSHF